MRTIRISEEVYGQIAKRGSFGETPDDVLRRVFKLPPKSGVTLKHQRRSSGNTDRLSAWVEQEQLHLSFQSGNAESWDLPPKHDKDGIRKVRDQAVEFAEGYGATLGQMNAVKKALTDSGYWLTKQAPIPQLKGGKSMALPQYQDIVRLIKTGATIEAQEKIMELRETALKYQDENFDLRSRVKELEAALSLRDRLKWEKPHYVDKENSEEKFCQRCYDADGKAIRLQDIETGSWQCLECSSAYLDSNYDPFDGNQNQWFRSDNRILSAT